jgi:hypothetical protein
MRIFHAGGSVRADRVNRLSTNTAGYAVLVVLAVVSVIQLAITLHYCKYGFDFTDEGVYVVSISIPEAYRAQATLFGFVYKPLHTLLNGDIAAIRQVNLLATVLLAWLLCWLALREHFFQGERFALGAISFSLATLSLASFAPLGATPSYNFLAFQAVTIAFCGLLLLDEQKPVCRITAILAIALGGWLAFMAKPTTALALALLVPLYAVVVGRWSHVASLLWAAAVAGCLVLGSALAIDGSIVEFLHRLERSRSLLRELGVGHDLMHIFRIDSFPTNEIERAVILSAILAIMILSIAIQHGTTLVRGLAACICALIAAAVAYCMIRGSILRINAWILFSISSFVALAGFVWCCPAVSRRAVVLALSLMIAPHVYAFGTNNNYWTQGPAVALYWVLAAAVLMAPLRKGAGGIFAFVPVAVVTQLILALLLNDVIARPYRQPPQSLRENASRLRLGDHGEVILSEGFAQYITDARRVATEAGFRSRAPMIDLTGQSPGLLYALGARGLGLAWMTGGYLGSDRYAAGALAMVDCNDIAAAWLLDENGPRSLTFDVIARGFGAQRSDYQPVGAFKTGAFAGEYPQQRTQWLLKPIRSVEAAAQACEAARFREKAEAQQ